MLIALMLQLFIEEKDNNVFLRRQLGSMRVYIYTYTERENQEGGVSG